MTTLLPDWYTSLPEHPYAELTVEAQQSGTAQIRFPVDCEVRQIIVRNLGRMGGGTRDLGETVVERIGVRGSADDRTGWVLHDLPVRMFSANRTGMPLEIRVKKGQVLSVTLRAGHKPIVVGLVATGRPMYVYD